jgi:hypothetical protein
LVDSTVIKTALQISLMDNFQNFGHNPVNCLVTYRFDCEPKHDLAKVNAWVIIIGVIPYLIPRIGLYKREGSATKLGIGVVATFISILILFMAFIGLNNRSLGSGSLLLVIAVQLQLIMNYVIVRMNYVTASRNAIIRWCLRRDIKDESSQSALILVLSGLPFIVPMIVIFYLTL